MGSGNHVIHTMQTSYEVPLHTICCFSLRHALILSLVSWFNSSIVFINVYDMVSNMLQTLGKDTDIGFYCSLSRVFSPTLEIRLGLVRTKKKTCCCEGVSMDVLITMKFRDLSFWCGSSRTWILLWWPWIRESHRCFCCWAQDRSSRCFVQVSFLMIWSWWWWWWYNGLIRRKWITDHPLLPH